ncbi:MAG: rhodanese-like domain-containing protein [Anaerolineae bacterium]|nr:rhodanese-like domain-containing protein [Anaerolineae bacterium]
MKYRIPLFITFLVLATLACQSLVPSTVEPFIVSTEAPLPTQPQPGQQPQGNQPPLTEAQVPRISVSDAKAAVDSGQATLVDVRSADSYAAGHAAGAISIPLGNFEVNIDKLSLEKDQWIITYCT